MIDPVIVVPERSFDRELPQAKLYYGDHVLTLLQGLPDNSVHMVCTSPPYWGLRDYGVPPQDWPEMKYTPLFGCPEVVVPAQQVPLGLEADPTHYVAHMVAICREVRRVLRPDGTFWLNIGDSYIGSNNTDLGSRPIGAGAGLTSASQMRNLWRDLPGKNLIGIPWRVAYALQADGWFFRSDVVWAKRNCMPEPTTDRPIRAHEFVFLFAKDRMYFYDQEAIRENAADYSRKGGDAPTQDGVSTHGQGSQTLHQMNPDGRYRRDVWRISTVSYKGAHFATWPPRLAELMILAGTSEKGVCPHCGSPWKREVELVGGRTTGRRKEFGTTQEAEAKGVLNDSRTMGKGSKNLIAAHVTKGWNPTCDCPDNIPARAVVMDIFSGSGTTGQVALSRGRDYIGLDLNPEYLELAKNRIREYQPPTKEEDDQDGLDPKAKKWKMEASYDPLTGDVDED